MEYHPGGWDELIKGAGRDATDLFNDAHRCDIVKGFFKWALKQNFFCKKLLMFESD